MVLLSGNPAFGQSEPIKADNTLGAESSQVVPLDDVGFPVDTISGGAIRGGNLFHSFERFNVEQLRSAYFINPSNDIQNILSRVTGGNPSEILGTLGISNNPGVTSSPNLIFSNPNGIVFGEGASLDVPGSFVATTANAVQFGEQGFFSATEPGKSSLLSVEPSALFFNSLSKNGSILNSSRTTITIPGFNPTRFGLRVEPGKSFLLVGGDIKMNGGGIFAQGSRVELGGLAEAGSVELVPNEGIISLSFPNGVKRSNVSFTNGALVNVIAPISGEITFNAWNVELSEFSLVLAGITESLGDSNTRAGNIDINAQREVILKDKSIISNIIFPGTTGNGGDINITTSSLSVTNGAFLTTSTAGKGDAGNINIIASDKISFDGISKDFEEFGNDGFISGAISIVFFGATGSGGDINITTGSLSVTNGAQFSASTFAQGNAGNINIDARDRVLFDGSKNGSVSSAFTQVQLDATGKGGRINVTTDSFSLKNGAQLTVSTLGKGNAGTIEVHARDLINISGKSSNFFSGLVVESASTTGTAGDIIITSPKITLDNTGTLNAESTSGNGGNINLTSDLLLLRRDAQISTNAGTAQQGGDGGNIDINSKTIVAIPQEDSDITANAFEGKGGNININTQGIFGIEPASANIPLRNDITASSELGITGNINLNAPDNSSIQNSLSDLQQNPIDTNALIANSCIARSRKRESTFNITGAGGLPQRPGDTAASNYPTGEVQNLADKIQSSEWKPGEPILEPQGVYELPSGKLILSRECS